MPWRSVRTDLPAMVMWPMLKNLSSGGLRAQHLLHHLHGVRALDLETVGLAIERVRARGRALVELHLHVVAAGGGVKANPVEHRNASDEVELIRGQVEQDHVADHVAVVVAGHELLGFVHREAGEAVDAQVREQFQGVRSFHRQIGHVVGLVEEHAGLLPRLRLVPPVGEFRRHAGIDVGPGSADCGAG